MQMSFFARQKRANQKSKVEQAHDRMEPVGQHSLEFRVQNHHARGGGSCMLNGPFTLRATARTGLYQKRQISAPPLSKPSPGKPDQYGFLFRAMPKGNYVHLRYLSRLLLS